MIETEYRRPLLMACAVLLSTAGCTQPLIDNLPFIGGEDVLDVGTPTAFLTCAQPVGKSEDTEMVDDNGKTLHAGHNQLAIPSNAMPGNRRLVFSQPAGNQIRVEVDSAVKFKNDRSAVLRIDLRHCTASEKAGTWFIWRMSEGRGESQKLRTVMTPVQAVTVIDSTSVFMIAN